MDDALLEVRADLKDATSLAREYLARLRHLLNVYESGNTEAFFDSETLALCRRLTGAVMDETMRCIVETEGRSGENGTNVKLLAILKRDFSRRLRTLLMPIAGMHVAGNWQSPSHIVSQLSEAGLETGTVAPSAGDYKRDFHHDQRPFEQAFAKEYVRHHLHRPVRALLTSSCMSAITTVLQYLNQSLPRDAAVVAGRGTYFQTRYALNALFGPRVRYVDEFDTEEIVRVTRSLRPGVFLFDSLTGSSTLPSADLPRLFREIDAHTPDAAVIIDNSALPLAYQPFMDVPPFCRLRVFVVESLSKKYQFGFDRVNAGVIVHEFGESEGMFTARMHLGANIPDSACYTLPWPNRELLTRRFDRVERNAHFLANALERFRVSGASSVAAVRYPGLPSYAGYAWTRNRFCNGGLIAVEIQGHRTAEKYRTWIARSFQKAGKDGVPLVEGTGFGFDTTRVYAIPESVTESGDSFLRIAVGTETIAEVKELAHFFESVLT
jgi:cystathionine beta-lyase/cystathionine gamma-synthase